MFAIYTILAVVLSAVIESVRIKATYGKVQNVNKVISFTIGVCLYAVCLALIYSSNYYYTPSIFEVSVFTAFYVGVRGILYDPLLNLLRGKDVDYVSTTTNSIVDFIERVGLKWGFWTERVVYLCTAVFFGLLFAALNIKIGI